MNSPQDEVSAVHYTVNEEQDVLLQQILLQMQNMESRIQKLNQDWQAKELAGQPRVMVPVYAATSSSGMTARPSAPSAIRAEYGLNRSYRSATGRDRPESISE